MIDTHKDAASPSDTHSPPVSVTVASSSQGSPSTAASSLVSSNVKESSSSVMPSNDEVEAVIKMATSTKPTPDGRPPPGKDTRTQLFVGNVSLPSIPQSFHPISLLPCPKAFDLATRDQRYGAGRFVTSHVYHSLWSDAFVTRLL